jgi:hypothetical protein
MLSRTNLSFVRSRAAVVPRSTQPLEKKLAPAPIHGPFEKRPDELKRPYVVRPFQRDGHVAILQHIENRGMYREELDIERARMPKLAKTVAIHTDGSLAEREYEFAVPPVSVVFRDRHSVHLDELAECRRLSSDAWRSLRGEKNCVPVCKAPQEDHERKLNMLVFPYAVPTKLPLRAKPIVALKGNDYAAKTDEELGEDA